MTPEREEELRIMSLQGMQELFREKMGEWQDKDSLYCPTTKMTSNCFSCLYHECPWSLCNFDETAVRLPLPIDPENPSRGLSGMIDGDFILQRWPDLWSVTIAKPQMKYFEAATPTLALLKAIAHQIGEEV